MISQKEYFCATDHRFDTQQWLEVQFLEFIEAVTPEMRTLMTAQQEAWKQQTALLCEAEALMYDGGTLQPTIFEDCVRRAAERQACVISNFHEHYDNMRGAMSFNSACEN
jgi:hypothetical protein